jgi:hypothetical protein
MTKTISQRIFSIPLTLNLGIISIGLFALSLVLFWLPISRLFSLIALLIAPFVGLWGFFHGLTRLLKKQRDRETIIGTIIGLFTGVGVVLIVGGYIGYLYATTIHDVVKEGEKYGFHIGMTKDEVWEQLPKMSEQAPIGYVFTYGQSARLEYGPLKFDAEFKQRLFQEERWSLYYDEEYKWWDSIDLTFQNDILVEMYRHRQYWELP